MESALSFLVCRGKRASPVQWDSLRIIGQCVRLVLDCSQCCVERHLTEVKGDFIGAGTGSDKVCSTT